MDKETSLQLDEASKKFIDTHRVISLIECEYAFRQGAKWAIEYIEKKQEPKVQNG